MPVDQIAYQQTEFLQANFDPFTSMSLWATLVGSVPPSALLVFCCWFFYNQLKENRKMISEMGKTLAFVSQNQKDITTTLKHIKDNLSTEHGAQNTSLTNIQSILNAKL